MRILLVDFYDSFTFNLLHYLELQNVTVDVIRNDAKIDADILNQYTHVVLSPGPGLPSEKKNLHKIISLCSGKRPVLGICLGMQGIGEFLGGRMVNMKTVKHGVAESLIVNNQGVLFKGLPASFAVGLYHSWAISDIRDDYIDAKSTNGTIMAISCRVKKLYGVQFHPESILSDHGKKLIGNFINYA